MVFTAISMLVVAGLSLVLAQQIINYQNFEPNFGLNPHQYHSQICYDPNFN